jgi:hypothetical protein
MALSKEEKEAIVDALDKMADASMKLVIKSIESFTAWIEDAFQWIYKKIKNVIIDIWKWVKDTFS